MKSELAIPAGKCPGHIDLFSAMQPLYYGRDSLAPLTIDGIGMQFVTDLIFVNSSAAQHRASAWQSALDIIVVQGGSKISG